MNNPSKYVIIKEFFSGPSEPSSVLGSMGSIKGVSPACGCNHQVLSTMDERLAAMQQQFIARITLKLAAWMTPITQAFLMQRYASWLTVGSALQAAK